MQVRVTLAICIAFLFSTAGNAACKDVADAIHINQVGFNVAGAKLAVVVADGAAPLPYELVDAKGNTVSQGKTRVFGDDDLSGMHLHHADFSAATRRGSGYRLRTGCTQSHAFQIADHPFGTLTYDALAYFYHNRAGIPIDGGLAGGAAWARPAGHTSEVASCRGGEDRHGNDWPGCDYTLDVTGGWYDAGDHGKYVVNGGITIWTLLNLFESQHAFDWIDTFADGQVAIPEAGNRVNDLLDEVRYEIEFFLRMQVPDGTRASLPVGIRRNGPDVNFSDIDASGMVHHKVSDVKWAPLPLAPHNNKEQRVLFPVSTAATLNFAAATAQCARIWRNIDVDFAAYCQQSAERAFAAALRNPEVYFIADFPGSGMYGDGDLSDEFFWAAAELFVSTGDASYRKHVEASPHFRTPLNREHAWPHVAPLGLISLAVVENDLKTGEVQRLRDMLVDAAKQFAAERDQVGYHVPFATSQYAWGSNSNILNRAMILALAYEFSGNKQYRNAAIDAMDYILGRNPLDQSYVSGYGQRPMQNPHHRFWAPSFDYGMPPPPPGALSGGPNSTNPADEVAREIIGKCAPQTCWRDDVRAFSLNEVAINWNSPLVWVANFLDQPANTTNTEETSQ